ncbi:MAG: hypothetical protein V1750_08635 [Acidobacteriota bacterium]
MVVQFPRRVLPLTAAIGLLLGLAVACHHAPPAPQLPAGWHELQAGATPFVALYRLHCCGRSNLAATVRADGERLALVVAAPPGGALAEVWLAADGGWLHRAGKDCRERLPVGELPLSDGARLPLDARFAWFLLGGLLPEEARPVADAPGWVESRERGGWYRARVAGEPPRLERVLVGRLAAETPLLVAELGKHRGHLPGWLALEAGAARAELALVEWRVARGLAPPSWLTLPECRETP